MKKFDSLRKIKDATPKPRQNTSVPVFETHRNFVSGVYNLSMYMRVFTIFHEFAEYLKY